MNDIKKGDTIRYSEYIYGVQCIGKGVVSEVNEDGSCVIDKGNAEIIVDKKSIVERLPRKEEIAVKKPVVDKTEEEQFNSMHKGISIRKKENKKEETTKKESKFNHFGEK